MTSKLDQRLFDAIYRGDEARVEAALRDGAKMDSLDERGCPALIVAILIDNTRITKLLLARGADVHWRHAGNGATAVHAGAQVGQVGNAEVVRLLAELGANVETSRNTGATPAFIAALKGNADIIRLLADYGADV